MKIKTIAWIIGVVIILSLVPAGVLFWQNQNLERQVAQYAGELDIKHQSLSKSLQRAETKIAKSSNELSIFAKQNEVNIDAINKDLRKLNGRLEAISVTEAKTNTVIHTYSSSDTSRQTNTEVTICKEDGRPIDIHRYTETTETRELTDSNGMRVADVSFSAAEKRPWNSKVYGIKYKILNTIGRGSKGQLILSTELIAENPEAQPNKTFRIEGIESRTLQAPKPGPKFKVWDPALYLLMNLGVIAYKEVDFSASLGFGFSVFSYGPDWRFLGITVGYDAFQNAFRGSLVPFLYNIGSPLPLLSNLYLGLDIGLSSQLDISIGLIIGTRL
jgi:hypothetical protein